MPLHETKEDWWIYLENKNKKIPHPWLIKEFKEKLKNRVFSISNFNNFVKNINVISKKKISESTLNDIKDSQGYISFSGMEGYSGHGVISKGYSASGAFQNVNAGIGSSVLIGNSPFIEKGTRAISFSKDSLSHNSIYIPSGISPYSSENQGMFSAVSLNTSTDNEQKMIKLEETIKSLESKVEKLIKEKE